MALTSMLGIWISKDLLEQWAGDPAVGVSKGPRAGQRAAGALTSPALSPHLLGVCEEGGPWRVPASGTVFKETETLACSGSHSKQVPDS